MEMAWMRVMLVVWFGAALAHACTTVLVTKGASSTGEAFVAHSNDGEGDTDGRIFKVPPMDHPKGSERPVFPSHLPFPRYVGDARGKRNYPKVIGVQEKESEPIGYIDEVEHTYGLVEGSYGIGNEAGVVMAESTCSAIFTAAPLPEGKALFSIEQLSQIGLERASSARAAIQIMGDLAEEYGFYGPGFEGRGESLLVADKDEGWIFHILADDTGASAVWAAQRVPDAHVAVVPNVFVIREMNLNDTTNFLASGNILKVATNKKLWTPGTPFDFSKIYSDGEYSSKYYSGRRHWRAFNMLAPHSTAQSNLQPLYGNIRYDAPYPATLALARGDRKISVQDVMRVLRDSYEGTAYDLTSGVASGPYGNPNRYNPGNGEAELHGAWERSINIYRSTYTFIAIANSQTIWFGPHAAKTTVYAPVAVKAPHVPQVFMDCWQGNFSRGSAFWAIRYVANIAELKYSYMIKDIHALQQKYEALGSRLVETSRQSLQPDFQAFDSHATAIVARWWKLADELMFKYADGFLSEWSSETARFTSKPTGYPTSWLLKTSYIEGPPPLDRASWNNTCGPRKPPHQLISTDH